MCRVVAHSLDDGRKALFCDRQEGVSGSSSLDGVNCNVDRAVLFISEARG